MLTLAGHSQSVTSVCYSPDGLHIVTGSCDHTAIVWNAITGMMGGGLILLLHIFLTTSRYLLKGAAVIGILCPLYRPRSDTQYPTPPINNGGMMMVAPVVPYHQYTWKRNSNTDVGC